MSHVRRPLLGEAQCPQTWRPDESGIWFNLVALKLHRPTCDRTVRFKRPFPPPAPNWALRLQDVEPVLRDVADDFGQFILRD